MSDPNNPTKPRWRPRFSLRTLMIVVLLIACSWTVTFLWGVPGMKNYFSLQTVEFKVLAPFVIYCKYEDTHVSIDGTWIWFFGFKKMWSGQYVKRLTFTAF